MAKQFTYKKTTLNSYNGRSNSTASNCYFKGNTVCWEVLSTNGESFCAVRLKKHAIALANFLDSIDYAGDGDPIELFISHCRETGDWDTVFKIKEV